MQLLFVIALAVALPALVSRRLDFPDNLAGQGTTSDFDPPKEIANLRKNQPDWILIGNSMLNSRIDSAPLSTTSGFKTRKVSKGGSQSALWFLFLKNVIVESETRPALVTVFFRDTDLTWAGVRTKGINEGFIAALEGPAQPEWQQVFGDSGTGPGGIPGLVTGWLDRLFPANDLRPMARRQMQERAFRLTRIGTKANSSVRRAELNERFSLAHLRRDLGADSAPSGGGTMADTIQVDGEVIDPGFYEDGPVEFDASPETSFLPHLVALAKDQGIRLHFHRIKRRPATNHSRPDPPRLREYLSGLEAYLDEQGCLFTDESPDLRLTLEMYADGDHISSDDAIQARYLENFWERVSPIVGPVLEADRASPR